jgi:hypothetical protein
MTVCLYSLVSSFYGCVDFFLNWSGSMLCPWSRFQTESNWENFGGVLVGMKACFLVSSTLFVFVLVWCPSLCLTVMDYRELQEIRCVI